MHSLHGRWICVPHALSAWALDMCVLSIAAKYKLHLQIDRFSRPRTSGMLGHLYKCAICEYKPVSIFSDLLDQ